MKSGSKARKLGFPKRRAASRAARGLAFALAIHLLFLAAIVVGPASKPPPALAVAMGMPIVSVSLFAGERPSLVAQSRDVSAANEAAAKQPLADMTATPPPAERIDPALRPSLEAEAMPLDRSIAPPRLDQEPMPLHDQPALPASIGAAPPSAGSPDCHLAAAIQSAFGMDGDVRAAVGRLPRRSRSVANAVMIWRGDWVADPESDRAPETVIREALQAIVQATSSSCRDQPMRGPEFITVTNGSDTTVLVVGSGDWNWAQLLR